MRDKIITFLKKVLPGDTEFGMAIPEDKTFGHYSTTVAFSLAKKTGKIPLDIARDIVSKLEKKVPSGFFKKIEVASPGFINFWISKEVLRNEMKEILKKKERYGQLKLKRRKIQIEFISANPTGPLTLANGRGGFLGDVLSNVLELSGYKVEREYYVNDTGNQIITLGKSLAASTGLISTEENFYKGAYVTDWANTHKSFIEKHKDNYLKLGQLAAKDFLKDTKKTLRVAGIIFDRWTSEDKHIHKKGFVDKALKIFKDKNLVYEKDGALWLKTTEFGDDKDRVLMTRDEFPTYFLADVGHYLETKKRGFRTKINILGPDHHGYVKRIQAAARILGLHRSKIIVTQAIRIIKKGKEMKMSKRRGDFVTLEDLVGEVGVDVARFFFLMHAPESHMDFDLELAKERSTKNPVYYVQYAYVRAIKILEKAGSPSMYQRTSRHGSKNIRELSTEVDINLIRELVRFPEIIEDSANDYRVHRLTRYATELAHRFHDFYEKEKVVGEKNELESARLALVQATTIVLKNLLEILGISTPKKM